MPAYAAPAPCASQTNAKQGWHWHWPTNCQGSSQAVWLLRPVRLLGLGPACLPCPLAVFRRGGGGREGREAQAKTRMDVP